MVIGFVEHQGRISPKGEGFVTTLVKIPCNKGKIITLVDKTFIPS